MNRKSFVYTDSDSPIEVDYEVGVKIAMQMEKRVKGVRSFNVKNALKFKVRTRYN